MANKKSGMQANKETLKRLTDLMNGLGQKYSIKVGILQPEGSKKAEGTEDLSLADLGAVHEFGANINHPGGQPYYINPSTGSAVFVSKKSDFGKYLISKGQVTKPHEINIPARSFLREPILGKEGKKELLKVVEDNIDDNIMEDLSANTIETIMDKTIHTIAGTALSLVQDAFQDNKIKPPVKNTSKKQRKKNPQAPALMDTGQLKKSISYEIKKV